MTAGTFLEDIGDKCTQSGEIFGEYVVGTI